jgi:glyoxylase-like metal-dependent hydrolase (beta-lactamase superfamily II)
MNEYQQAPLGHFTLYTIQTGYFRLDGGAMFGVVPKTLWSRGIDCDDKNRIPMGMRSLLIKSEKTDRLYLIDTGIGNKADEKFRKIYDMDDEEYNLDAGLAHWGFSKDDVTDVVFTHLHFDHGGGAVTKNDDLELEITFPNAQHWVQEKHWETAINPNVREKASYLRENIEPLKTFDKLNKIQPDHEFEPGFTLEIVNGHTIAQQLPKLSDGKTTLLYGADLLPTHLHVPIPWVMGYDMYPATTLEEKAEILERAADENWFIFLEHDYNVDTIQITNEKGRYTANTSASFGEWNQ